jgi:RNA polymerase sigma factor (TIGR02999 family)
MRRETPPDPPIPGEIPSPWGQRPDVTTLLVDWRRGDRAAYDALFPLIYDDLRLRARRALRGESSDHDLSTTALVHEAYLKLVDVERVDWQDRAHFLAVAATAMRRILVSQARRHKALKRGGRAVRLSLDEAAPIATERSEWMLTLDLALEKLGQNSERLATVVELRFFGGLTIEETAEVLGVAPSTVQLDWTKAKAWLYRELAA